MNVLFKIKKKTSGDIHVFHPLKRGVRQKCDRYIFKVEKSIGKSVTTKKGESENLEKGRATLEDVTESTIFSNGYYC